MKYILFLFIMLLSIKEAGAETIFAPSDTLHSTRLNSFLITSGTAYTGSMVGLNQLWYADHERGPFHFEDDWNHWQQMNEIGHTTTGYWTGYYGMQFLRWSGVSESRSIWYGGLYGLPFMTTIEVFDGFSEAWGFSWTDQAANMAGPALLIGQEKLWGEQRFQLKFSFTRSGLASYRPEQLGHNFIEESLKDYNGQTYWLSFPANMMLPGDPAPDWLNISPGYSGNNMLGAVENPSHNDAGEQLPNYSQHRQYYLSLDVNLLEADIENPWLRHMVRGLAFIKLPFPAMEYNPEDGLQGHWMYF